MQLFVIINNNKTEDKCRCECKELIDKVYVIKDILGIVVIVSVNVINHVILVSIKVMKILNVKKGW